MNAYSLNLRLTATLKATIKLHATYIAFTENQLLTNLIGLSPLTPSHPMTLQRQLVRPCLVQSCQKLARSFSGTIDYWFSKRSCSFCARGLKGLRESGPRPPALLIPSRVFWSSKGALKTKTRDRFSQSYSLPFQSITLRQNT